jgi:ubiquinone biosynthesis protein COQ9
MSEFDRDAVLLAALPDVPFEGWSCHAMIAAGKRLGLDRAEVGAMFPGGPRDLVAAFSRWADLRMLEALARRDLEAMNTSEQISAGIMARLETLAPHREAARRALAILALPHNAPLGLRLLYETVDALWAAAGDRATDFNFYTKRALLAGVYGATSLYWFEDRSPDFEATRAFLERRLGDTARVSKFRDGLRERFDWLPNPARFARTLRQPR